MRMRTGRWGFGGLPPGQGPLRGPDTGPYAGSKVGDREPEYTKRPGANPAGDVGRGTGAAPL